MRGWLAPAVAGPGLLRSNLESAEPPSDLSPLRHAVWARGRQPGPQACCPAAARGYFGLDLGVSLGRYAHSAPRLPRLCGDHGEGHQGNSRDLFSGVCAWEELWSVGS